MNIFKRIFDAADSMITALYAKRDASDEAAWPVLVDENGNLRVNMTVGTVSLSSTASTITNAASNPVPVSLTTTKVTVDNSPLNVNVATATLGTVTVTGTVTPSTTAATITNAAGNPVNVALSSTVVTAHLSTSASRVTVDIALSSTVVTVKSAVAGFNVNVATATLGTVTTSLSSTLVTAHLSPSASLVTASLSSTRVTATLISGQTAIDGNTGAVSAATPRTVIANDTGRTLTRSTGSLSATIGSITITPTNGAKVYAYSLSTTSASEVVCVFYDGGFTTARELWRVTLMAPSGANSGANLAISPPGWIFKSRSASSVCLSLSTAALVHYSIAWYDEA